MLGSARWQNLLIALVIFGAVASAQEPVEAVYLQGRVKEIPGKKAGKIDFSDPEVLRFAWDKGEWKAPYSQIKTIYLSMTRQSVMVEVFGVPGARRKVLMSLVFTDEQGNSRNGVFILPGPSNYALLQALEKRSGRQAVYESAEARKSVGAPP